MSHTPARSSERSDRTWALAVLAGVVSLGAVLRAWGLHAGLPDFFEEALPLRWALQMRDGAGLEALRPTHFNYPSLGLYLHEAAQAAADFAGRARGAWASAADYRVLFELDPTPHVVAARLVSWLAGVATVAGLTRVAARLHPNAALTTGLLAAFCVPLVTASRQIYVDVWMVALAVWALERWLAWAQGDVRAWVWAAVLSGLATGAKYPAAALLLPAAWLIWSVEGAAGASRLVQSAGIALGVFAATTPYALIEPQRFLTDLRMESEHARGGHLGSVGRAAGLYHARGLVDGLGWPALLAALAAPVAAWRRGAARDVTAVLLALLGFALPIAFAHIEADRYLLPVIAFALPLAGWTTAVLAGRNGAWAGTLTLVLLAGAIGRPARLAPAEDDTRAQARRWCEAHLPRDRIVITEAYGAPLFFEGQRDVLRRSPAFAKASPAVRRRVDERPAWIVVPLPLEVSGRIDVRGADGESAITAWDDITQLSNAYYDPRLVTGAGYVITSSAVRDRFAADPARYPAPLRLYALLERHAKRVAHFAGASGPAIDVWQLAPGDTAYGHPATLEPWWWTGTVAPAFRREADARMQPPVPDPGSSAALPDGSPRPWVRALAPVFNGRVRTLLEALAVEHGTLNQPELAFAYTLPALWMAPGDLEMAAIAAHAAREAGLADDGRQILERAVDESARPPDAKLTLEYAACLAVLGQRERAEALIAPLGPGARIALAEIVARAGKAR